MNIAQIDNLLEEKLVYSEFLSATNRQKCAKLFLIIALIKELV
jgi:hypothetical protein